MVSRGSFSGLGTRVAVRTYLMFCLCAGVPIVISTVIGYRIVTAKLQEHAASRLMETSKSYGLLVFERLRAADEMLFELADLHLRGNAPAPDLSGVGFRHFRFIDVDSAALSDEPPRSADALISDRTDRVSLSLHKAEAGSSVWLTVSRRAGTRQVRMTGALLDAYLWDADAITLNSTQICVNAPLGALQCVGESPGNDAVIRADWPLYLPPRYGARPWVIHSRQPEAVALDARASLRRILPITTLIAIAIALLLSVIQIRRSHQPLTLLTEAARRIGKRRFDQRLGIESNDEYAKLGRAFDRMADGLSRQFGLLRTLARIDRLILADPTMAAVMKRILPSLPGLLRSRVVAVALHAKEGVTVFMAGRGMMPARFVQLEMHGRDLPALMKAIDRQDGTLAEAGYQELAAASGAPKMTGFPIEVATRLKGVLLLDGDVSSVTPVQRRLAQAFTRRFAVALGSEERRESLLRQAYYDELTGLPNRQLFKDRLGRELMHAKQANAPVALIYIDLDRFKNVNDSMGHGAGDELLQEVSRRFSSQIGVSDTLARLGGDEFVVIASHPKDEPAHVLAERLQFVLREPIVVQGSACFVRASIGVTVFPEDGETADLLLRNADIAMYRAKAAGRDGIAYFEDTMNRDAQRRLQVEQRLRVALRERTLQLAYQPKISLLDGSLQGVEALARWTDSELGPVSPVVFIAVAEECGLIEELGAWALHEACATFMKLQRAGLDLRHMSVNASMRQLREQRFLTDVTSALQRSGMSARSLEIEVTESMLADNPQKVAAVLEELRRLGVRISIDDFGTGYSSMAALSVMPADVIKIDRSFVTDCATTSAAASVVEAVISMAHALGKMTVAEGVETREQLFTLRRLGCDLVQGYLFARPMSEAELGLLPTRLDSWAGLIAESAVTTSASHRSPSFAAQKANSIR